MFGTNALDETIFTSVGIAHVVDDDLYKIYSNKLYKVTKKDNKEEMDFYPEGTDINIEYSSISLTSGLDYYDGYWYTVSKDGLIKVSMDLKNSEVIYPASEFHLATIV